MAAAVITMLTELPKTHLTDLTGMQSGRLTIISISHKKVFSKGSQVYYWNAKCSCGNSVTINGQHFMNGQIKSCGCLLSEACSKKFRANPVRRDPSLPPVQRFTAKEIVGKGFGIPDWLDKKFGRLRVSDLVGVDLYYIRNWRTKEGSLTRKLVSRWLCVCTCGCEVERTSDYLHKHKANGTCQKCRRKGSRNFKHVPEDPWGVKESSW